MLKACVLKFVLICVYVCIVFMLKCVCEHLCAFEHLCTWNVHCGICALSPASSLASPGLGFKQVVLGLSSVSEAEFRFSDHKMGRVLSFGWVSLGVQFCPVPCLW